MLDLRPLSDALGAEVRGVKLNADCSQETVQDIYAAWLKYQVLIFRDQTISAEDHGRVATYFGQSQAVRTAARAKSAAHFISNIPIDGIPGDLPHGDMQFHTDGAYDEVPTKATLLFGMQIPSRGGDTLFSNGYKAFELLPLATRTRISRLSALNAYDYGTGGTKRISTVSPNAPKFVHPAVVVHPETGRKSLYVNRLMTLEIVDMPRAESDALLETLFQAIERPEIIYAHKWRPGDLVVWDNRCTFHARTDFDPAEKRVLRRMTTKGSRPVGVIEAAS